MEADFSGVESRLDNIATALGYTSDLRAAHYREIINTTAAPTYPSEANDGDHFTFIDTDAAVIKEYVSLLGDWVEISSTSY